MKTINTFPPLVALRARFGQRLHRVGYFFFNLLLGAVLIGAIFAIVKLTGSPEPNGLFKVAMVSLYWLLSPFYIYATVRRLHDFNQSGWWALIFLIPISWEPWSYVLMVLNLVILFFPGSKGANRYGYRKDQLVEHPQGIPTLDGKPPF